MIQGVLVAFVIMVALVPIPIVHIVGIPFGPFIGGYFGVSLAGGGFPSPASKALVFGGLLGLVWLSVSVGAAIVLNLIMGWNLVLLLGVAAVFTLYTASMGALGAMYSLLRSSG